MNEKKNPAEPSSAEKNYELKSDAVDALLNAETDETPEFSEEELKKYRSKSRFHIPDTLKVLFIKAWFAGAVCFFLIFGLGTYLASLLDMLFVVGVVMGMVTDLLVNNAIRFIAPTEGEFDKWLMFPKKGMLSFFLNILYSFLIMFLVYELYIVVNLAIAALTGDPTAVGLGVEPILFGVFWMGFDVLFLGIKRLIKNIFADALGKGSTD